MPGDDLTSDEARYTLALARAELRRVEAEALTHREGGPVRAAFEASATTWRTIIGKLERQATRDASCGADATEVSHPVGGRAYPTPRR